jgi:hypothetical protein
MAATAPTIAIFAKTPPMHLVSCASPPEPLESAPRTALLADLTEGEQWDGFWSSKSDAYFVRCTRDTGETQWFSLADDASDETSKDSNNRVLALRPKNGMRSRVAVVVAQSPNGQRMLVGSARRTIR